MDAATLTILVVAALATAALSAVAGMGGGVTLLGIMAWLLPAEIVVPVHGLVQLMSNATRTALLVRYVHRRIFLFYIGPAVLGVFAGARWYVGSDLPWFRPAVGGFILLYLLTLLREPRLGRLPHWTFAPLGFGVGSLSSLIGATGPLIAPFFLRDDMDKHQIIGTKAAIQISVHLAKVPAFFLLGFSYGAYWRLWLPLAAAAITGTWLGTRILARLSQRMFRGVFVAVLVAISVQLIFFS